MSSTLSATSVGLGLRRALLGPLQDAAPGDFDFLECAPENWIGVGGKYGEAFERLAASHPITCHGLSLSLGGFAPLDETFLGRVRRFVGDRDDGVAFVDITPCSREHGASMLATDGLHPSAEMYTLWTQHVLPVARSLLSK